MIHSFTFNGEDSRDYGIYIVNKTAFNKPEKDVSMIQVPGRNGDLIIDNGGYKNLNIKYNLRLFARDIIGTNEPSDFSFAFERVANWLRAGNNYSVLTDTYNPGYYRYACITSSISVTQRHPMIADFAVTFSCKPYKYHMDSTDIELTRNTSITNYENAESLPLIRVYTNVEYDSETETQHYFSFGGTMFHIKNINGYVDIDSETMNVYKGTTSMNNNYYNDTFPTIKPGSNEIVFVQNVSKLVISPRWRAI